MNVLVITQFIPMPDRQADMLRLMEVLRIAAARHSISLLATDVARQLHIYGDECVSACIGSLEALGIRFCSESQAVAAPADYEVVLFEYYPLALSRMERMRYRFPRAVMVIDTVDINHLRLASQARANRTDEGISTEARAVRDLELRTYSSADLVVAVSRDESRLLQQDLPSQNLHVIPLIVDVPAPGPRTGSSGRLLFVGNFNHQANVDAARFMIDRIWPIVRRAIPQATLMIVGNRPPPTLVSDPSQGVKVTGFVPDLTAYYQDCEIGIAPLTWGGGLKGKVAEAMAHGLPVVTTSIGASGFDLLHRVHAMVADTPEDFAAAVVELHEDHELYRQIGLQGRAFVDARYSRNVAAAAVDGLFTLTARISPIRLPRSRRLRLALRIAFHRHLGWRRESAATTPMTAPRET